MEEPVIRIGLVAVGSGAEHLSATVRISYDRVARVLKNGSEVAQLEGGESYTFTPTAFDTWRIEPTLDPSDSLAGVVTIESYTSLAYDGSNDNRFHGTIEALVADDGTIWLVNELKLEEYLKGVAETINGEHPEYSKAFAIAARSYALHHLERGGKRVGEPFTLRRTSQDQLYKGYNFERRASDPVAGVIATRGTVATYSGKAIRSAYSSGAPGPTKDSCDVFGGIFCGSEFDYLRGGVEDPPGTTYTYSSCTSANHCVGIDAAGGRQLAELGSTAAQIILYYYPGTEIEFKW